MGWVGVGWGCPPVTMAPCGGCWEVPEDVGTGMEGLDAGCAAVGGPYLDADADGAGAAAEAGLVLCASAGCAGGAVASSAFLAVMGLELNVCMGAMVMTFALGCRRR